MFVTHRMLVMYATILLTIGVIVGYTIKTIAADNIIYAIILVALYIIGDYFFTKWYLKRKSIQP